MNEKLIILPVSTNLDIPAERVLNAAIDQNIDPVVLVGRDEEGQLYLASSRASASETIVELLCAIRELLEMIYE